MNPKFFETIKCRSYLVGTPWENDKTKWISDVFDLVEKEQKKVTLVEADPVTGDIKPIEAKTSLSEEQRKEVERMISKEREDLHAKILTELERFASSHNYALMQAVRHIIEDLLNNSPSFANTVARLVVGTSSFREHALDYMLSGYTAEPTLVLLFERFLNNKFSSSVFFEDFFKAIVAYKKKITDSEESTQLFNSAVAEMFIKGKTLVERAVKLV